MKVVDFIPAKLSKGKSWFIYYSILIKATGLKKRIKLTENINRIANLAERETKANEIIVELNERLKSGWRPDIATFKYQDNLAYKLDKKVLPMKNDLRFYVNQFIEVNKANWRKKTIESRVSKCRWLLDWCNANSIRQISHFSELSAIKFLKDFSGSGRSAQTVNGYLFVAKQFFEYLIECKIINKNPFVRVKPLKTNNESKLPFNLMQIELIKAEIVTQKPQLWLFCLFIFSCFLRPRELRFLKLNNIDHFAGKIRVPGEIAKNKRTQFVAIPAQISALIFTSGIMNYPDNYYIFGADGKPGLQPRPENYFYNQFRMVLDKLKINHQYSLYSWKHTGAVMLVKKGTSLKAIKEQLRHSSLDMTDRYLKSLGALDFDELKENFPTI